MEKEKVMSGFRINIYLTTSKLCAYIILIIGSIFSFYFHDGSVLLATFSAVSAILMMKTWTQSRTDQKNIETSGEKLPLINKKEEEIG